MRSVPDGSAHKRHSTLIKVIERILLIIRSIIHDIVSAGAENVGVVMSYFVE